MSVLEVREPQLTLIGVPTLRGAGDSEIRVETIPKELAEQIIRAGHYSHSTCWASSLHLGVFKGDRLIGALQYGPLMNPGSAPTIVAGSSSDSCMELNRLWLADDKPANTATRVLRYSLRILRSRRPGVEWVQSFADERCGKLGGCLPSGILSLLRRAHRHLPGT